ncbi:hypothetical protein DSO57_1033801 [Entomophthora muscae]|uniref:Uncharacterized protein n=1 Tax=Entomophthora muscae TaxID=34485 RepID=A0ACC2S244_9FUNG|nr:hypothetical protein DSO57_1033801 [Entomophthora muscae]
MDFSSEAVASQKCTVLRNPDAASREVMETFRLLGVVGTKAKGWGLKSFLSFNKNELMEYTHTNLSVREVALGDWSFGLQIVALRINLESLSPEAQLFVFTRIHAPKLVELGLWSLVPSNRIIDAISLKFKTLVEFRVSYRRPQFSGMDLLPSLQSLRTASVGFTTNNCRKEPILMDIPAPFSLENLTKLDLGNIELRYPCHNKASPIGPQIKELRVAVAHPIHFITFHFPKIHTLSYHLKTGTLDPYICISRFKHLKTLSLESIPNHPFHVLPLIQSVTVTCLTLCNVSELDRLFWVWISETFPKLNRLNINSTEIFKARIPPNIRCAMPTLRIFQTQATLPKEFWDGLACFAPFVERISD